MKKISLALGLYLFTPIAAFAHPGHPMTTSWQGFIHPFSGLDHLLVMLAVGFFAARQPRGLKWQLPLMFLVAMTAGLLIGAHLQTNMVWAELAVALSVISMGFVLLLRSTVAGKPALALIATFAALHGLVHGQEMVTSGNWFAPASGVLLATTILLTIGFVIGAKKTQARLLERTFASVLMLAGSWLLITV